MDSMVDISQYPMGPSAAKKWACLPGDAKATLTWALDIASTQHWLVLEFQYVSRRVGQHLVEIFWLRIGDARFLVADSSTNPKPIILDFELDD